MRTALIADDGPPLRRQARSTLSLESIVLMRS
jgi:hypothetical protein